MEFSADTLPALHSRRDGSRVGTSLYKPLRYPAFRLAHGELHAAQRVTVRSHELSGTPQSMQSAHLEAQDNHRNNKALVSTCLKNQSNKAGPNAHRRYDEIYLFHSEKATLQTLANMGESYKHISRGIEEEEEDFPYSEKNGKQDIPQAMFGGYQEVYKRTIHPRTVYFSEEDKFTLHLTLLNLYKDRIRPVCSEIKYRLEEQRCSPFLKEHYIHFYEKAASSYVISTSADEAVSIYLKDAPPWFRGWVDIKEPCNRYPLPLWDLFNDHLQYGGLGIRKPSTPTNHLSDSTLGYQQPEPPHCKSSRHARYSLAKRFKELEPKKLKSYALGELCHLIELAVLNGLLVYDGELFIWSANCPWFVASTFYWKNLEFHNFGSGMSLISDIDDFRLKLKEILMETSSQFVYFSKLKQKFLKRFNKIINPLVFNYQRLSDLLCDKCQRECRLLKYGGQIVVRENTTFDDVSTLDESVSFEQQLFVPPVSYKYMVDNASLHQENQLIKLLRFYKVRHNSISLLFWQYTLRHRSRLPVADTSWRNRKKPLWLLEMLKTHMNEESGTPLCNENLNHTMHFSWEQENEWLCGTSSDACNYSQHQSLFSGSGSDWPFQQPLNGILEDRGLYSFMDVPARRLEDCPNRFLDVSTYEKDAWDNFPCNFVVYEEDDMASHTTSWMDSMIQEEQLVHRLRVAMDRKLPDVCNLVFRFSQEWLPLEFRQLLHYYTAICKATKEQRVQPAAPYKDEIISSFSSFQWFPVSNEDQLRLHHEAVVEKDQDVLSTPNLSTLNTNEALMPQPFFFSNDPVQYASGETSMDAQSSFATAPAYDSEIAFLQSQPLSGLFLDCLTNYLWPGGHAVFSSVLSENPLFLDKKNSLAQTTICLASEATSEKSACAPSPNNLFITDALDSSIM